MVDYGSFAYIIIALIAVMFVISIPVMYRKVVPTNEVHIVQSSKKTLSYGKDTGNGSCACSRSKKS